MQEGIVCMKDWERGISLLFCKNWKINYKMLDEILKLRLLKPKKFSKISQKESKGPKR
jgi:hypothetical protein